MPNPIGGMALAPVQNASKFGKVVCVVFSEKQVIKLFHQDYVKLAQKKLKSIKNKYSSYIIHVQTYM